MLPIISFPIMWALVIFIEILLNTRKEYNKITKLDLLLESLENQNNKLNYIGIMLIQIVGLLHINKNNMTSHSHEDENDVDNQFK